MESQPSHAAPGLQPSSLHACWLIWSGGGRTTTLCVLTTPFEWRSCSHESEVAYVWHNGIGSVLPPWPPAELPDDGLPARCSRAPYRRFPLESDDGQVQVPCHGVEWVGKEPAEEVGRGL